ncbi:MAG: phosphopentomutase [Armatimonadota bacterium]
MGRVLLIVLDGCGAGAAPDAANYGPYDSLSNTLGNVASAVGGLTVPNLQSLGFGNITPMVGVAPRPDAPAVWGRLTERNAGKDTVAGHWEMMGIPLVEPFPNYPDGIPAAIQNLIKSFLGQAGICNQPMSGTDAIRVFGDEHCETGAPIVYTSADSVLQIAAHEEVFGLERLYALCAFLREHVTTCRVIARPFIGKPGSFIRSSNRRDWTRQPDTQSVLDALSATDVPIMLVGRTTELFPSRETFTLNPTTNNQEHMDAVSAWLNQTAPVDDALCFANFEDFDMLYGHRNDPVGFAKALEAVDEWLGAELLPKLVGDDIVILTADHGNDPTIPGTDHSREYAPLLCFGPGVTASGDAGVLSTFAAVGINVAAKLGVSFSSDAYRFLH